MAFELGAIIARIKADTSDFKKGINDAKGDLNGFNDFMGRSQTAARGLVAGLAVAAAGVVALGGVMVKSAASLEQTRIGFEGLIGDGEKAGKLMRDLSKFAAETPFEFPELAKSAKLLMAFGDSAEEVLPHLRIIGDTVSTMGGGAPEIDRVTRAIGQMAAKGKITAEEMNQLSEIGVNGFKLLAQGTGKTEAELRKMSETGTLMAEDMLPILYEQMQKDYGGGMERQSKSLIGMFSTLRDEVMMFGRELIGMNSDGSIVEGGIFDRLKDTMQGFLDWLLANKEQIKSSIKEIFEWVQTNMPIIIGILGTLLVAAFWSAAGAAAAFMLSIAPLIAIGAALGVAFMLLQPHFETIWAWVQTYLVPAFTALYEKLKELWEIAVPLLIAAWNALAPVFAFLWGILVNTLVPAFKTLWDELKALWDVISPILIPVLIALAAIFGGLLVAMIFMFIGALLVIATIVNVVIQAFAFARSFIETVFRNLALSAEMFGMMFKAVIDVALGAFIGFGNMLRNIFNAVMNGIGQMARQVMQGDFVGAFRTGVDIVRGVINQISGFVTGMVNSVISAVARVKEGISAPFREAVNNIKGMMADAKAALSNLNPFQRHSPSLVDWVRRGTRVIADEYGDLSNSISAGTVAARIETIGTARSFANVSAAQVAVQGSGGAQGRPISINLNGVLADSPEAKRRLGTELVKLINDGLEAKGKGTIPV